MSVPLADPAAVAMLALVAPPIWTDTVVGAMSTDGAFPVDDLHAFVDAAVQDGLVERRRSFAVDGTPQLRFWADPAQRRRIVEELQDRLGDDVVAEASISLAHAVLGIVEADVPPALRDWASLTVGGSSGNRSAELLDRVREEVDRGELSRAQELCAVGESVASVFRGTMELAADRSRRVLELAHRRRADEAALTHYLRRRSTDDALRSTLADAEHPWLHLRGAGGVGKSMFVRDVGSGRFAAHHGLGDVVVARVDFDRLKPDFPVRQPVALLIALADELVLAAATNPSADRSLIAFQSMAVSAHESVSATRDRGGGLAASLANPLVESSVDRFAEAIAAFGVPVLLVLDTCEELAKAYPGTDVPPAVAATYGLLERLQSGARNLRVLLCGRRELPAHEHLRVVALHGFDEDEARTMVRGAAARDLDADLIDAILDQSPAVIEPDRYNPFDLDLCVSWINEDPSVDADALRARGSARIRRAAHPAAAARHRPTPGVGPDRRIAGDRRARRGHLGVVVRRGGRRAGRDRDLHRARQAGVGGARPGDGHDVDGRRRHAPPAAGVLRHRCPSRGGRSQRSTASPNGCVACSPTRHGPRCR